jgi:hypothetical protein
MTWNQNFNDIFFLIFASIVASSSKPSCCVEITIASMRVGLLRRYILMLPVILRLT